MSQHSKWGAAREWPQDTADDLSYRHACKARQSAGVSESELEEAKGLVSRMTTEGFKRAMGGSEALLARLEQV